MQLVNVAGKTAHVGDTGSHQETVVAQMQQGAERFVPQDLCRSTITQHREIAAELSVGDSGHERAVVFDGMTHAGL